MAFLIRLILIVSLTILCWGSYGPLLHKGSVAMEGSRFRPFLAVGISYFFIAVVLPLFLIMSGDKGKFTLAGTSWSLAAGAAGAVGAFGILLAFNVGGKPSYVMPLVFGLAPVVNAFWSIYVAGTWKNVSPWFLSGLILVAVGAVVVLWFKPPEKAHTAQPPAPTAVAEKPNGGE